jgi:hypothetical protein
MHFTAQVQVLHSTAKFANKIQRLTSWLINALYVPSFVLPCPVTHFYSTTVGPPPPPIDFVEQNSFVAPINPVASGLVQLTPTSEQFLKQILAFVAVLVITATVSARSFPFTVVAPWFRRSRTGGFNSQEQEGNLRQGASSFNSHRVLILHVPPCRPFPVLQCRLLWLLRGLLGPF